ncbi:hypothetical protein BHM03_00030395, partial [Ensete ventricosum]
RRSPPRRRQKKKPGAGRSFQEDPRGYHVRCRSSGQVPPEATFHSRSRLAMLIPSLLPAICRIDVVLDIVVDVVLVTGEGGKGEGWRGARTRQRYKRPRQRPNDVATGGALTLVSLIRLCSKIDLGQHEGMGWLAERGRGCRDGSVMNTVVVGLEEVLGLVMAWR